MLPNPFQVCTLTQQMSNPFLKVTYSIVERLGKVTYSIEEYTLFH